MPLIRAKIRTGSRPGPWLRDRPCGPVGGEQAIGGSVPLEVELLVLCCPSGTAMGWPSWAGPRAGISPLRERASPPPGDPGARPAASDPGLAGPARQRRSASRAPWARAGFFKSSGRRWLRSLLTPTSSPSRADVAGSGRSGPRLALRHGSRTLTVCGSPHHVAIAPGGVRGPAGRCAAAGVVTWRPRGPVEDCVCTTGSTPAVVTVTWGTAGDAVPPCSSTPMRRPLAQRYWHPV
jgi:hypothetical protein